LKCEPKEVQGQTTMVGAKVNNECFMEVVRRKQKIKTKVAPTIYQVQHQP
jgi:hypothetical protein